jgi:hypothetical protein
VEQDQVNERPEILDTLTRRNKSPVARELERHLRPAPPVVSVPREGSLAKQQLAMENARRARAEHVAKYGEPPPKRKEKKLSDWERIVANPPRTFSTQRRKGT